MCLEPFLDTLPHSLCLLQITEVVLEKKYLLGLNREEFSRVPYLASAFFQF